MATDREGVLTGNVKLDNQWDRIAYLSYIPSFEDMYAMSHDMIIASAPIDSSGNFLFDLSFLPTETQLYRIHLQKKGDTKTTLIIGGKEENFLFLFAKREEAIRLQASGITPPFGKVVFSTPMINQQFQQINESIVRSDSIASESSAMKRSFILTKLEEDLMTIADTSSNALIAAYAFHRTNISPDDERFMEFSRTFQEKWPQSSISYDKPLRISRTNTVSSQTWLIVVVLCGIALLVIGYGLGRYLPADSKRQTKVKELSLQERKVYELLQQSASNKDISEALNIGISTVKSHVSSILSKMEVKSRKDLAKIE